MATLLASEAVDDRAAGDATPTARDAAYAGVEEGARRDFAERADDRAAAATTDANVAGVGAAAASAADAGGSGAAPVELVEPGYDSLQRRAVAARDLHAVVGAEHAEAIEARMSADVANARPVTDVAPAVGRVGAQAGRRRPLIGRGQARGVER